MSGRAPTYSLGRKAYDEVIHRDNLVLAGR